MTKQCHIHRLFMFFCVVMTTSVWTACDGNEKGQPQEQAAVVGLAATGAHAHEKKGETCFICDPSKRDKGRLWCQEHGRYEDRCWICHPELEDKKRLYCKEHSLYEDECFICHPELKPKDLSGGRSEKGLFAATVPTAELFCNEHQVPEKVCGICQPQLAATLLPGQNLLVRLPSIESAQKAGILTEVPLRGENTSEISVLCEVQYNKNTLTKITPLANGIVHRVFSDVGEQVLAGDVLAELHSVEMALAKSAYLSALVTFHIKQETKEREKRLVEESISAQKDFLEAEASFRMAQLEVSNTRQKLLNLGLSPQAIIEIGQTEDTSALLKIRAPFKGTLIDRTVVTGQSVASGDALFTLADLSTRWLVLSMPSDHQSEIRVGQHVEARFDDFPGETVHGKIVWIDTAIDTRTRLVSARVLATSGIERMKAGLYGQAKVISQTVRPGLLVPRDAVQYHEKHPFVFVKQDPDLYALRRVSLGAISERLIEIVDGLKPTEAVVTTSSFLVMSEFLKSRLGAGCADD